MDKIKKKDAIKLLEQYYKSINRTKYPDLNTYKIQELRKCIILFNLK
jgi:hypothetical protein